MAFYDALARSLEALGQAGCRRALPQVPPGLVNLSSNDYLGL